MELICRLSKEEYFECLKAFVSAKLKVSVEVVNCDITGDPSDGLDVFVETVPQKDIVICAPGFVEGLQKRIAELERSLDHDAAAKVARALGKRRGR